ncbi:MAG: dTDP-glucose 4,6-dehydratase [Deltaproteobacteria bacterium]|nr:dTDP-glucose 4,6-dehydratase [Deltaproteobacteria bacterium]
MQTILITGGAGFIGSNFTRLVNGYPDFRCVVLDKLTYAGHLSTIEEVLGPDCIFVKGDIADAVEVDSLFSQYKFDYVVNFAAESHVDRSIEEPGVFVRSNVFGVQVLLDACRRHGVTKYLQVSTDEVYGELSDTGLFTEDMPLDPSSPYSASKASGDLLVQAWHRTYGLPVNITRCSNNYGPYQFPEKLIPVIITRALDNALIPVYGNGLNVRDWIHVEDHCSALFSVLMHGQSGRVYNIGGQSERTNLDVVRTILKILGHSESLITFVEDRKGHDWRYAIDNTRIQTELNWHPKHSFEQGLVDTIQWYLDNQKWLETLNHSTD